MNHIIKEIINIQQQYPNIYVGGSVALILQKAIPFRKPKDVDLISLDKLNIFDIFSTVKHRRPSIKTHVYNNIRFEIFNNPKAEYIEYNHNGHILKLSPVQEIMDWKLKRIDKKPDIKHSNDIEYLYT